MDDIHQFEVVIHVDETLNEEQRSRLVSNLQVHDGVEKAKFTTGRDHLIVIKYDSNKLHSDTVLGYVKQEHVNAELVGI
jgi:hypothetical protein